MVTRAAKVLMALNLQKHSHSLPFPSWHHVAFHHLARYFEVPFSFRLSSVMQVSRSICISDVSVDEPLLTITAALAYKFCLIKVPL